MAYTRLCKQVINDVVSTITVVCRRKLNMPNSYVVGWSVGTVGLAFPVLKASLSPCSAALDSNLRSRADRINKLSGDVGATWRMALKQVHSKHKTVFDDAVVMLSVA